MATGFNKYKDKRDAVKLACLLDDMCTPQSTVTRTCRYRMDTIFKVRKVGGVYRVFFKPPVDIDYDRWTDEFDADWDLICPRMVTN